ncbi:MAG: hypothetical protein HY400_05115, partial [Elusimicrobia bacterium]|nr:hypothetical protein [Elusimicrobiota bacterium]
MILLFLLLILFTVSLGILGSGTIVNTSHRTLLTIFPDQFKLVFER